MQGVVNSGGQFERGGVDHDVGDAGAPEPHLAGLVDAAARAVAIAEGHVDLADGVLEAGEGEPHAAVHELVEGGGDVDVAGSNLELHGFLLRMV
jgi:hypothetical protein